MDAAIQQLSRHEYDEQLIDAVRQFPCLYDPSCKDYRDVGRTSAAWAEAAKMCDNMDTALCKERWRKLRDAYVKVNKKLTSKEEGARQHTNWPYYELMSFLTDFVRHRRRGTDLDSSSDGKPRKAVKVEYRVDGSPIQIIHGQESSALNSTSKRMVWSDESGTPKAKKACRNMDTIELALLESLGQGGKIPTDTVTDDEEGLFGKMVAATLRRFPARAKALCKFRIQEIIFDQENQNLSSPSP